MFNMVAECVAINVIDEMIKRKEQYSVILDNFDSVYNYKNYTPLFKSYNSDNIECIIGVRDERIIEE